GIANPMIALGYQPSERHLPKGFQCLLVARSPCSAAQPEKRCGVVGQSQGAGDAASLMPKATKMPPVSRSSTFTADGCRRNRPRGTVAAISTANQASVNAICRQARKKE